jgi:hypothetical protein
MTALLQTLDEGDFMTILIVIGILAWVGGMMAHPGTAIRHWGWRMAGAGFVAYAIYAGVVLRPQEPEQWIHILLRGLLAGGLLMTLSWILLSTTAFVLRSIAAFLRFSSLRATAAARRRQQTDEQYRADMVRQQAEHRAQEQERARRSAEDARRCEDARLRCLLAYDRHGAILVKRLPRERLEEYLKRYMPDTASPEVIEERARIFIGMMDEWVAEEKSREKKRFSSLEELAAYFQKQREEAAKLAYDDQTKNTFETNVNNQEQQAIRRFLSDA